MSGDIEDVVVPLIRNNNNHVVEKGKNGRLIDDQPVVASIVRLRSISTANKPMRFEGDSFVPGVHQTIYMRTWGCAHNNSDSEYMAGLLSSAGYTISDRPDGADLWLLNSCTVKTPSETQLENQLNAAKLVDVPVVVAGCVSQAAPNTAWLKGISLLGVQQIDRVVSVVEETLKGNSVRLLACKRTNGRKTGGAALDLPKMRKNNLVEILAIHTGCLNHCTYCKTKQARGDLASYHLDELLDRVRQAFNEGVKEIWLTSEDLGAWGRDIGLVLPDLLDPLVKLIPDGCMLRLGMTNPPYILDHLEDIARILNHPRVYAFLHIPVQSGSDSVLTDMRREYTSADFCTVVDYMNKQFSHIRYFKKHPIWMIRLIFAVETLIVAFCSVPSISIATDMICAFPTETVDDFEQSMALVRKYQFPTLFINRYYPRAGTPAARMKRIDTIEAKNRTRAMSQLFHSYRTYGDDRIGRIYDVLITERASDDVHLVGHNKSYEQILVPDRAQLLGCMARVRIVSCSKFSMLAELIDTSRTRPNVDPRVTTGYCWPSSTNAIVVVFVVVVIVYWLLRHLH